MITLKRYEYVHGHIEMHLTHTHTHTHNQFMAEYEDSEMGAVEEGCESDREEAGEYENILLQSVVENFEKHFKDQPHTYVSREQPL